MFPPLRSFYSEKNLLPWLFSGFQFTLIILSLFLFGCSKPTLTMEEMKPYEGPIMEIDNLETIFSETAETSVKLKAARQLELQNGNREFPNGLLVEFYEHGILKTTLTSNTGTYYKEANKYKVAGHVVIKNLKEERQMETEEMFWIPEESNDANKGRIIVDDTKQVIITTKTEVLRGMGLNAAQDLSDYSMTQITGHKNY